MNPAAKLRVELTEARTRGQSFEVAWADALAHALEGVASAEWALALAWTRAEFEAAYLGRRRRRGPSLFEAMETVSLAEVAV